MTIIDTINRDGQRFVDDPVYIQPKRRSLLELSVAYAFGQRSVPGPILIGYRRVRLKWLRPDGDGNVGLA